MSDNGSIGEEEVEVMFMHASEVSSGEEQDISEWSSLEILAEPENVKRNLYKQGLYSPGSPEICSKYIPLSDSAILRHLYYNYPAVLDPGIEKALLGPEPSVIYPNNGQQLYLDTCADMNICPVRLFHKGLLKSEINLSYYGVNPKGVCAMALALENNLNVVRLDLTDNFLTNDCCYHLGEMLRTNVKLKELILNGCRIGATGLKCLGSKLHLNNSLVTLNLARNNLQDDGGVVFADLLFQGFKVKDVNLSNNYLDRETCKALRENYQFNTTIQRLDLSWNTFLHTPSTVKMLEIIATSRKLEELNLCFNSFTGNIASAILLILRIPSLTMLNLSNNRLQGEPLAFIADSLRFAKKLNTFNLSFNPLSPDDAYYVLSTFLKPRVKVQNLLMEGVCVDPPFIELLNRVKRMKSRKNFVISHGEVLCNWVIVGPNKQELVLKRGVYLGTVNKKNRVDIALYFLSLNKEFSRPIPVKMLIERVDFDNCPLGETLVEEFGNAFPGPTGKSRTVDIAAICEMIRRMYPEKKLPPTPPPEPEPEPETEPVPPPPPPKKAKEKK